MFYRGRVGNSELPCPVLYTQDVASRFSRPPVVALLLEWKQDVDERGARSWLGLIVWAIGGAGKGGSWELRQTWVPSYKLTPISGVPSRRPAGPTQHRTA